ncbi:MAG: hypothetical protein C0522_13660 [Rhodocyclaceae bacterium]|nr:hypothetical protein [Rhodocyclaceae bacterium]
MVNSRASTASAKARRRNSPRSRSSTRTRPQRSGRICWSGRPPRNAKRSGSCALGRTESRSRQPPTTGEAHGYSRHHRCRRAGRVLRVGLSARLPECAAVRRAGAAGSRRPPAGVDP